MGPTTPAALLDRAFSHLTTAGADVLLLLGDFVFLDATEEKARELASRVRAVAAPHRFAVLGNHDLWTDHAVLERSLAASGVRLHINRVSHLPAPHAGVAIVGLDDPWTGEPQVETTMREASDAHTIVVICHSPESVHHVDACARRMRRRPEVVYVCGHTHGGHIATPLGAAVVPGRLGKRYPRGLHRLDRTSLVVSKGLGGIELPVRSYARPDVMVLDLVPGCR